MSIQENTRRFIVLFAGRFTVLFAGLFAVLLLSSAVLEAQPAVALPRASPSATVSQTIGYTDVTVADSRFAVKDRKVWGQLVPYGYLTATLRQSMEGRSQ